jgi:metal-dependent amidase/aminoacylase/carboxypeptidase family protein
MSDKGVKAIYAAARAVGRLEAFDFNVARPVMGAPTLNVGTLHGGLNLNSVPDRAEILIDIPGMRHGLLREWSAMRKPLRTLPTAPLGRFLHRARSAHPRRSK